MREKINHIETGEITVTEQSLKYTIIKSVASTGGRRGLFELAPPPRPPRLVNFMVSMGFSDPKGTGAELLESPYNSPLDSVLVKDYSPPSPQQFCTRPRFQLI